MLRPGDIVRLRAGGPDMTVVSYNDRFVPVEAEVTWTEDDGTRQTKTIPADLLELKP